MNRETKKFINSNGFTLVKLPELPLSHTYIDKTKNIILWCDYKEKHICFLRAVEYRWGLYSAHKKNTTQIELEKLYNRIIEKFYK